MQSFNEIPRFHYLIVAATIFPILAMPLGISSGVGDLFGNYDTTVVTLAVGNGHVAATMFFFFDKGARNIVQENPYRFIIIPLTLCVLFTGITFMTGLEGWRYLVFVNVLYLFFHYQKQNFGLMSLANRGLPREADTLVKGVLFLPMIAGCLVYGSHILDGSAVMNAFGLTPAMVRPVAAAFFAGGILSLLLLVIRHGQALNPIAMILAVLTSTFFLPLYFYPDNPAFAFSVFATAHGAQYLLIMSFTMAGTRNSILILRSVATILVVLLLMELLQHSMVLTGIVMGLTWGHYMIDARIWKLSLPDSREYVMSRIKRYL